MVRAVPRPRLIVLVAAVSLALLATVVRPAAPAAASWGWCWGDPTLVIAGQTVHIDLGVPIGDRGYIKGSTLTVVVPAGVDARLTGTNSPNFPITVTLVHSGRWSGAGAIPVSATAVVNAPSTVTTSQKAWQSNTGNTVQVTANGGSTLHVGFSVAR
jgi:hypothetical protein